MRDDDDGDLESKQAENENARGTGAPDLFPEAAFEDTFLRTCTHTAEERKERSGTSMSEYREATSAFAKKKNTRAAVKQRPRFRP